MTTPDASDRYMIISSDCHAGLPCEQYRPYLEKTYEPQFEAFLAERNANRAEALKLNYDYIMNWETENEEGLKGAYDSARRDKELDADGVSAEVMFADSDAVTGMESPPFGAGLSAGTIADPELAFAGARAHNRFLEELCAENPPSSGRHRPRADLPRRRPRRRGDRTHRRPRPASAGS